MYEINIHATALRIESAGRAFAAPPETGILLLGASGAGKSDLALRLVAAGAVLVADDRTLLAVEGGRLIAKAPVTLAGLLEVRGLGIVALPHAAHAVLGLAVVLGPAAARLPEPEVWHPEGLEGAPALPVLRVDAFSPSATARIALAAAAYANGTLRS